MHGGDVAGRLVQREVEKALGLFDELAVHFDVVGVEVRLGAEFGDDTTVDLYRTCADEFIGATSRGNAGIGNGLVQSLWRVGRFVFAICLCLLTRRFVLRLRTLLALRWSGWSSLIAHGDSHRVREEDR